jgi:hypothetical protein
MASVTPHAVHWTASAGLLWPQFWQYMVFPWWPADCKDAPM